MSKRILIIDDERDIRLSLAGILGDEGYAVLEAESGADGLGVLESEAVDLVFLDIWMPGIDGLAVLERIAEQWPGLPVIMISGHGTIETAVNAIKKGAFDFIEKPLSLEKIIISAAKALEFRDLMRENRELRARVGSRHERRLTGRSDVMVRLREQIERVAPTDAWVLITGENGTGKEIVARHIHATSRRSGKPMVEINCAAIPEELIEKELFGHEKGAFTGADRAQEGKFELADGGTLFLDEIADMSLKTQAKILRILQEQRFERVGGRKTYNVDVRVIAATNKDLPSEIRNGSFREDLYYRLKVFPIEVPPLRARAEDIPLLINEFLDQYRVEHGLGPLTFSDEAMAALIRYPWPGNVRELKNFVERMLIMQGAGTVGLSDLPAEIAHAAEDDGQDGKDEPIASGMPNDFKNARALFEARFLEERLRECGGNVARLAEMVGLERSSLYRKLKACGVNVQEESR